MAVNYLRGLNILMQLRISELDIIFLSYDEPNCEQNWARVQELCARALRVHGVKGSDAAHKACAELASTDRLLIIDGDNWVDEALFSQTFELSDSWRAEASVLSYTAENSVNGLKYGNGGVKIWPRRVVLDMQTHEAVGGQGIAGTDFCWAVDYILMPGCWSQSRINHTQQQAWRAGFREAVKMSLVDGAWIQDPYQWREHIARVNLRRLETWLQVGRDVDNGVWAILGARQGLARVMLEGWDPSGVQDFDVLDSIWARSAENIKDPLPTIRDLGQDLVTELGVAIAPEPLNAEQSRWYKHWANWEARREPRRLKG